MKRLWQLDGIRALAFLAVFLHHGVHFPMLWAGVDVFFVLSGFLVTGVLRREMSEQHPWRHFYSRRARRILPPYLLFLVSLSLCYSVDWRNVWYWYLLPLANVAGSFYPDLRNWPGGVLWSLAIEEQFYLLWPLFVFRLERKTLLGLLTTIIVLCPIARGLCTHLFQKHFPIYFLTPFRIDLLALGSLLALVRERHARNAQWRRYGSIALGAGLILFLALSPLPSFRTYSNSPIFNVLGYECSAAVSVGLIALAVGLEGGWLCRLLSSRVLVYVGTISYSCYLVHELALALAGRWLPASGQTLIFLAALAGTIAYATASWFLMEKWMTLRGAIFQQTR